MASELDINVNEYSYFGGEASEMVGRVPSLIVECLLFLLKKHADDPEAMELIERLRDG
ncbi:MAG: hypothetical protein WB421_14060 [Terriglobales bacterium]